MMHFCTLFDSTYLSRGLIMYESIKQNSNEFHLYIFAFDTLAYEILLKMRLDNTTIISLKEFENQDLLAIKSTRTRAEYCWTSTSSVIDYVLKNFDVPSCTYLDADLFFYDSPIKILNELQNDNTVLITEHGFSKFAKLFEQKRAGRFCVQFITFTNSRASKDILEKWISQCIDWCYARYEDGKFGDQKYLEHWPEEYSNVHVIRHKGGGVAPWNVGQYKFIQDKNKYWGVVNSNNEKFEVIFFHFHFVRIMSNGHVDLGWNRLSNTVIDLFYKPYINKILEKERFIAKAYPRYKTIYADGKPEGIRDTIKYLYKRIAKFNLLKLPAN